MNKTKPAGLAGLFLAALLACGAFAQDAAAPGLVLLSEAEAVALSLGENAKVISAAVRGPGPRIHLESPALRQDAEGQEIAETEAEAKLVALFADKDKVDMGKFEMEVRNGNRVLSLTDRLRPYITENRLDARHLRIPPGRFEIDIRIEDKQGRVAEKNYLWVVKN